MVLSARNQNVHAILQLLASDQSTTYMLENIVQAPLAVRVFQQEIVTASHVHLPEAMQRLSVQPDTPILFRHSGLFTPDAVQVSENVVIVRLDLGEETLDELHKGQIPIIKIMEKTHPTSTRTILSFGKRRARFAGRDVMACFKHYTIEAEQQAFMYLEEVFSPAHIELIDKNQLPV